MTVAGEPGGGGRHHCQVSVRADLDRALHPDDPLAPIDSHLHGSFADDRQQPAVRGRPRTPHGTVRPFGNKDQWRGRGVVKQVT